MGGFVHLLNFEELFAWKLAESPRQSG